MIVLVVVLVALFLEIMVPTALISLAPRLSIRLLEAVRLYGRGTLSVGTSTYVAGSGAHRSGPTFTYRPPRGAERFENGRVFGALLLACLPAIVVTAVVVAALLGRRG